MKTYSIDSRDFAPPIQGGQGRESQEIEQSGELIALVGLWCAACAMVGYFLVILQG